MASLVDVLVPDVTENPAPTGAEAVQTPAVETPDPEASLPEKLRGKSREEIAAMYVNLESVNGRMANDLGAQRRLTDQFLELKRERDLGSQQPARPRPTVKVDELLDKPTETLERYSSEREAELEKRVQARLAAIEGNIAQTRFVQKHADYAQVANDPGFVNWVQSSQYRQRVANAAFNGDWNAADELLTEYKDRQGSVAPPPASRAAPAARTEAARAASLESSSSASASAPGSSTKSGETFKRAELMEMRLKNPDAYYDEAFQARVIAAYNDGRVK